MVISFGAIKILKVETDKNILFNLVNLIAPSSISKGLVICGLISILLSTADSFYHTCGIIVSHDILKNTTSIKNYSSKILKITKISTLIISIVSVILSLNSDHFVKLSILSMEITAPILLAPLIIGLLKIKVHKVDFILGALSGILGLFLSKYFLTSQTQPISIPIGVISSGTIFMISNIFQNRGIAIINRGL